MVKMYAQMEVKIGERIYHLSCEPNSPIPEVKEALFQLSSQIAEIEKRAAEEAAAQPAPAVAPSDVEFVPVEDHPKIEEING